MKNIVVFKLKHMLGMFVWLFLVIISTRAHSEERVLTVTGELPLSQFKKKCLESYVWSKFLGYSFSTSQGGLRSYKFHFEYSKSEFSVAKVFFFIEAIANKKGDVVQIMLPVVDQSGASDFELYVINLPKSDFNHRLRSSDLEIGNWVSMRNIHTSD